MKLISLINNLWLSLITISNNYREAQLRNFVWQILPDEPAYYLGASHAPAFLPC